MATSSAVEAADGSDDDDGRWWARLVPASEDAMGATHVDRAEMGATRARAVDGQRRAMKLRLKSTVIGRVVMNREGTARARGQPADLALEVPSGASMGDFDVCDFCFLKTGRAFGGLTRATRVL